jgi:hypothetical protein
MEDTICQGIRWEICPSLGGGGGVANGHERRKIKGNLKSKKGTTQMQKGQQ